MRNTGAIHRTLELTDGLTIKDNHCTMLTTSCPSQLVSCYNVMGRVWLQCLEKSKCLGTNSTGYHKKITFINVYYISDFLTEGMGFRFQDFRFQVWLLVVGEYTS